MTISTDKKSFILHYDSLDVFNLLSNEQAGKLIKAIIDVSKYGVCDLDEYALKIAIVPFINQFKRDDEKYKKIIERNKLNISKRWENKKKLNNTKTYETLPKIPELTKNTDNDNVSVSVSDNDSDSDYKKNITKKAQSFSLDFIADDSFRELMQEFVEHRKAIKKPFKTQRGVEIIYNKLLKLSSQDYEIARLIVDESIGCGYQGIFALKQSAVKKMGKEEETIAQYNMRMIQERLKQEDMGVNNA